MNNFVHFVFLSQTGLIFAIGFLLFFIPSELAGFWGSYEDCQLDGRPTQTSLQKQENFKQVRYCA